MFLLFGLRTRDRLVATQSGTCEYCGVTAMQSLVKRSTKFTLFFVPLFPVRAGRYYLDCTNCGTRRPVDRSAVGRLVAHAR